MGLLFNYCIFGGWSSEFSRHLSRQTPHCHDANSRQWAWRGQNQLTNKRERRGASQLDRKMQVCKLTSQITSNYFLN